MLFGEHAVLHGQPCIVTAVDLRVTVSLDLNSSGHLIIQSKSHAGKKEILSTPLAGLFSLEKYDPEARFVLSAIRRFYSQFNINQGITVTSRGPGQSYGLGTSSAVTVATLFGLFKQFAKPVNSDELFTHAHCVVLDVQKTGSGFDVASAIHGGTLLFQPGGKVEPIQVEPLPILIGFSGAKVSTTDLIKVVEARQAQDPSAIDQIFASIGEITRAAKTAMLQSDWKQVGGLVDRNQGYLEKLGVSVETLDRPIQAARQAGALGAKLSGAGGGDCMFAVVDDRSRRLVEKAIQTSGAQLLPLKTNSQGVRVEPEGA